MYREIVVKPSSYRMMTKIFTVTANTAIDHCIEIDQLTTGKAILAKRNAEYAAGKGINVAKTLESLQYQVTTFGFVGELSLDLFNTLESKYLKTDFTVVPGKTRSNITVIDTAHQQMHIKTDGYHVTTNVCRQLTQKLEDNINTNDIVVFSGSLPQGAPENQYQSWIELCHDKSAIVILDSSGKSLRNGIQARPFLIKPNLKELEEIVRRTLNSESDIVRAAKQLQAMGVQRVAVSMGEQGAIIVTEQLAYAVTMKKLVRQVVSSIGCGDALVAGLAVSMQKNMSAEEAITFAICCATANLSSQEPGRIDSSQFDLFKQQIIIRSL